MNSKELVHQWAHQHKSSGKCASIFYEGKSIYSYGYHFEMARIVLPGVVIVTTDSYSNTTAKHLSWVRVAISHMESYVLPSFTDHAGNVEYMIQTMEETFEKAARARQNKEWILNQIIESAKEVRRYAELFNVSITPEQETTIVKAESLADNMEEALAEIKAKLAIQQAKKLEARKEDIAKWLSCEKDYMPRDVPAVYLRINCKDKTQVETSLGVNVPIAEAKRLHKAIVKGLPVHGQHIGGYMIERFSNGELKAGCHLIKRSEIDRFAAQYGWK